MRAGQLRHQGTIYAVTDGKDADGGPTEAEGVFATVWAAIEPLSGTEQFQAQQVDAAVTTRIRIRYLAGVTAKMRFGVGTRRWDLHAVLNVDERNRELHLLATERP